MIVKPSVITVEETETKIIKTKEPKEFKEEALTPQEIFKDAQQKIKVLKGRYNSFSKFYYRSVEDIYEAWKALNTSLILTITDEIIAISAPVKDPHTGTLIQGSRIFVQATATIKDNQGNIIESTKAQAELGEGKAGMSSEQATGSASSYARKYALNGLFLLDDTDDPDSTSSSIKRSEKKVKDVETEEKIRTLKIKELQDLIRGDTSKTAKATAVLAGRSVIKLSVNEINEIIKAVQ